MDGASLFAGGGDALLTPPPRGASLSATGPASKATGVLPGAAPSAVAAANTAGGSVTEGTAPPPAGRSFSFAARTGQPQQPRRCVTESRLTSNAVAAAASSASGHRLQRPNGLLGYAASAAEADGGGCPQASPAAAASIRRASMTEGGYVGAAVRAPSMTHSSRPRLAWAAVPPLTQQQCAVLPASEGQRGAEASSSLPCFAGPGGAGEQAVRPWLRARSGRFMRAIKGIFQQGQHQTVRSTPRASALGDDTPVGAGAPQSTTASGRASSPSSVTGVRAAPDSEAAPSAGAGYNKKNRVDMTRIVGSKWTAMQETMGWRHFRVIQCRKGSGALAFVQMQASCDPATQLWMNAANLKDRDLWAAGWLQKSEMENPQGAMAGGVTCRACSGTGATPCPACDATGAVLLPPSALGLPPVPSVSHPAGEPEGGAGAADGSRSGSRSGSPLGGAGLGGSLGRRGGSDSGASTRPGVASGAGGEAAERAPGAEGLLASKDPALQGL
ncbi:hypothetical protein GPECTOR_50g558 [Gonium pectorale]|uniref:Uncharacterized protein n=1 Tax=Gonium pectorale TaxID=33097 RepID=A0A150G878_GONPE|nr:hypothetical protein GPECTOR_50g558 [Gonium pectorale]|eukprot:KXZ45765.1 hypothetical protein GPECTOR_50g558 [Gonium pectorale]